MKLVTSAFSILFVAMAVLAGTAQAADEAKVGNVQAPEAAPAKPAPAKDKVKPHSHHEERGLPSASGKASEGSPGGESKKNAAADTSKHFHPRDGK